MFEKLGRPTSRSGIQRIANDDNVGIKKISAGNFCVIDRWPESVLFDLQQLLDNHNSSSLFRSLFLSQTCPSSLYNFNFFLNYSLISKFPSYVRHFQNTFITFLICFILDWAKSQFPNWNRWINNSYISVSTIISSSIPRIGP